VAWFQVNRVEKNLNCSVGRIPYVFDASPAYLYSPGKWYVAKWQIMDLALKQALKMKAHITRVLTLNR
jgi:hypothetical protein